MESDQPIQNSTDDRFGRWSFSQRIAQVVAKRKDIGGHQIRLGLPVAGPLEPAPSLYARVVRINEFSESELLGRQTILYGKVRYFVKGTRRTNDF